MYCNRYDKQKHLSVKDIFKKNMKRPISKKKNELKIIWFVITCSHHKDVNEEHLGKK